MKEETTQDFKTIVFKNKEQLEITKKEFDKPLTMRLNNSSGIMMCNYAVADGDERDLIFNFNEIVFIKDSLSNIEKK